MPPVTGRCSECGDALYNPLAKTCSDNCRAKRARRIKRRQRNNAKNTSEKVHPRAASMSKAIDDDVVKDVVREELRPVVREAITEDVLRAASHLVNLTPRMVQLIEEDMESSDKVLRQRAYTLLARYTLGNQSIAPQPDAPPAQAMQVVFQMPRPDDAPAEMPVEAQAVDLRTCIECDVAKLPEDFVGGSDRCTVCHEALQQRVRERFGT